MRLLTKAAFLRAPLAAAVFYTEAPNSGTGDKETWEEEFGYI